MTRIHKIKVSIQNMLILLATVILFQFVLTSIDFVSFDQETTSLKIELLITENNKYQCFYDIHDDCKHCFREESSSWISVKGDSSWQTISYSIPLKKLKAIRLDFGRKNNVDIKIKAIYLEGIVDMNLLPLFTTSYDADIDQQKAYYKITTTGIDAYWTTDVITARIHSFIKKNAFWYTLFNDLIALYISNIIFVIVFATISLLRSPSKSKYVPSYIITLLFLIVICTPNLNSFLHLNLDSKDNTEKRSMLEEPVFSWNSLGSYFKEYEKYYDENFSFRNDLIALHANISISLFDISNTHKVVIGKKGWLFYNNKSDGDPTGNYQQNILVTDNDLTKIHKNITKIASFLDSLQIALLIVVTPDKQSIYPEFMPSNYVIKNPYGKGTRTDQVISCLRDSTQAHILDLRTVLLEKKDNSKFPLFYKLDSHWNAWGAFYGYKEIMNALSFKSRDESDYEAIQKKKESGDLALALSKKHWIEENNIQMNPNFDVNVSHENSTNIYGVSLIGTPLIYHNENAALPKLLMLRDSYAIELCRFLPQHFRESILLSTHRFSKEFIRKERPDVVIIEICERYMMDLRDAPQE